MHPAERQAKIEAYLQKAEFASLEELAQNVGASVSTVRRDLAARLVPAVPKHWQPWGEIADLFVGRSDPDWDRDRDLIDQSLMNSWERAHESGA